MSGTPNPPRLERDYMIGSSAAAAFEPGGISVFFSAFPSQFPRRTAFTVLDGTLVRLTFEPVPEEYVLAYFDSLRPVDKDDVEFTRA